jgi:hypothetical protein
MRVAYLILVHKNPEQVARLLQAIHHEANTYAIHVDSRAPQDLHRVARVFCGRHANALLVPSMRVTYLGWDTVKAELAGIRLLLKSDRPWDYLVNLSGQDFPLMTQEEHSHLLSQHNGKNFVVASPLQEWGPIKERRVRYWYAQINHRTQRLPIPRSLPADLSLHTGHQWVTITRSFAEFCVNGAMAKRLARYFRWTLVPDEMYFSTALMNSPFRDTCAQESLRKVSWHSAGNTPSPGTITMADIDWLFDSPACFARKFDPAVDAQVIEEIHSRLAANDRAQPQGHSTAAK